MTIKAIHPKSQLTAHMLLRLKDGSIAENTRRTGRPAKIFMGNGSLSEAFEKSLLGMQVGDKKIFHLNVDEAFGPALEENQMTFPRTQFGADIELEEGMIIEFQNREGGEMLGIVRHINGSDVQVDFNHPLAGQDIEVDIEILDIDSHELS